MSLKPASANTPLWFSERKRDEQLMFRTSRPPVDPTHPIMKHLRKSESFPGRSLTPCGRRDVDRCCSVVDAVVPASQELRPEPQRPGPTQNLDPSHLKQEAEKKQEMKTEMFVLN